MASRRINLLPPELAARKRNRQLVVATGAAGLALVAALGLVYGIEAIRARSARGKLETQRARNTELRTEVAGLAEFDRLQGDLKRRSDLLAGLTATEVRWSVLLSDVSMVIPSDVWLTGFTGTVSAATPATPGAASGENLGMIQMSGATFTHLDVARWLTRLGSVDEFVTPYLTLSSKGAIGDQPVVNFNSSVQLSGDAFRRRQPGAERRI